MGEALAAERLREDAIETALRLQEEALRLSVVLARPFQEFEERLRAVAVEASLLVE